MLGKFQLPVPMKQEWTTALATLLDNCLHYCMLGIYISNYSCVDGAVIMNNTILYPKTQTTYGNKAEIFQPKIGCLSDFNKKNRNCLLISDFANAKKKLTLSMSAFRNATERLERERRFQRLEIDDNK